MLNYLWTFFESAQFVPHAVCLLWRPDLLILHGTSDFLVMAAYFAIPWIIMKAVKTRPDLIDPKVAKLFAAFITACALSHLAGLVTLWLPIYGIQGLIKVATAAVSIYTAVQLAALLPIFLKMPSHQDMARKNAEVELERMRTAEAQESQAKLSEFAYIASHDLKAPMRGIANQAKFLVEDHGETLEPDARKRLDRMQELCGQLDNLISTLLKYSRVGHSKAREPVDPNVCINDVASSLAETLEEANVKIEIDGVLPFIEANPADVATVFRNLIVNGFTYNDAEEKRIHIGYAPEVILNGVYLTDAFYVRDNGIGIDEELHEDAFRMFKRLNQPEAYGSGSGAGWRLSRRSSRPTAARSSSTRDWKKEARSTSRSPSRSNRWCVSSNAQSRLPAMGDQTKPLDILVVEDSDDDFEATERALKKSSQIENDVKRCRDGLDAWDYLRGENNYAEPNRPERPGLILLDLNMPGLDGRKLLQRIKGHEALRRIPVVVLTTSSDEVDVAACYDAGVNTYVQKPVSWTEFTEAMKQLHSYWFRIAILSENTSNAPNAARG